MRARFLARFFFVVWVPVGGGGGVRVVGRDARLSASMRKGLLAENFANAIHGYAKFLRRPPAGIPGRTQNCKPE